MISVMRMSTSKVLRGCVVRRFSQFLNDIVVLYANKVVALFARTDIFGVFGILGGNVADDCASPSTNGSMASEAVTMETNVSFCTLRDIVFSLVKFMEHSRQIEIWLFC